jgi:hypothetical protein
MTGVLPLLLDRWPASGYDAAKIASDIVWASPFEEGLMAMMEKINVTIRERNTSYGMNMSDPASLGGVVGSVIRLDMAKHTMEYVLIGDSPIIIVFGDGRANILRSTSFDAFSRRTHLKMAEARNKGIRAAGTI